MLTQRFDKVGSLSVLRVKGGKTATLSGAANQSRVYWRWRHNFRAKFGYRAALRCDFAPRNVIYSSENVAACMPTSNTPSTTEPIFASQDAARIGL